MGRNFYHAVRPKRAIPEFDRLQRGRRGLTFASPAAADTVCEPSARRTPASSYSIALSILAIVAAIGIAPAFTYAGDSAPSSDNDSEVACQEIKSALNALADAEHREAFALDLASNGASTAIVAARLSDLLDRSQDLRVVLRRARQSKVASDSMVDQCTRMGFRALVISEKLSSDVESVLFAGDSDDSALAALPEVRSNGHVPSPAQLH